MLASAALVSSFVVLAAAAPVKRLVQTTEYVFDGNHLSNETFGTFDAREYSISNNSCGLDSFDTEYVVSIKTNSTDVKDVCGMQVTVTNLDNGKSVSAQVVDECVTCAYDYLLLSPAAYKEVSSAQKFTASYTFSNSSDSASSGSSSNEATSSSKSSSKNSDKASSTSFSSKSAKSTPSSSSSSAKSEWTPSSSSKKTEATLTSAYEQAAWTPSTTSAKQAVSTQSTQSYSGTATWYTQDGNAGSCGSVNSDSAYIVAMSYTQVDDGAHCGASVKITNTANGNSITAKVADTCPGCGYGSLDLSIGAFEGLGSLDSGVLPITWSFA